MYRAEKHRCAMVSLRETAISMAFFRPVHLWYHCGTGRTFVLSQHADVPIGGVTCLKYLLIIHLRKKISRLEKSVSRIIVSRWSLPWGGVAK
jgi:hypothetical protein